MPYSRQSPLNRRQEVRRDLWPLVDSTSLMSHATDAPTHSNEIVDRISLRGGWQAGLNPNYNSYLPTLAKVPLGS